ncbi:PP2C-domain-containing protein [Ascobolus immersus RN42]|uniref:PP2C-domain-containing protein n=1 Tax=Ascobolus immersus RN42 TaxID=1160509 RepID=A0A3N4IBS1_ASCIM|nr:PP2C-domain-containing protein [Ascobolus immersus RN42]
MFGTSPTASGEGAGGSKTPGTPPRGEKTVNLSESPVGTPSKKRRPSSSELSGAIAQSAKSGFPILNTKNVVPDKKELTSPEPQVPGTVGPNNNSAGDSRPGPKSTFRVGVTEDRNQKCRRTMEDTHSYLYNFSTKGTTKEAEGTEQTDDGYFAIFDGHAGTYAAEWCGKKLHLVLEENMRKNPGKPIPEILDSTFTDCDDQLEKLPVKSSGCTAVTAVLRWEDRPVEDEGAAPDSKLSTTRKRVLYTANVGDARIILCRNGKALRLSYDHKGSDDSEGKRVASAGGLILNNRVNGVLAVTRALGDSYMKELVTGHPYTTETVLTEEDEFILLACDGLWDVCSDQDAVNLVRDVDDPEQASKMLVDHALAKFSNDNLSCMIVRLDHNKLKKKEERDNGDAAPVQLSSGDKKEATPAPESKGTNPEVRDFSPTPVSPTTESKK